MTLDVQEIGPTIHQWDFKEFCITKATVSQVKGKSAGGTHFTRYIPGKDWYLEYTEAQKTQKQAEGFTTYSRDACTSEFTTALVNDRQEVETAKVFIPHLKSRY